MNRYFQRSYRAERRAFKELTAEGYYTIRASASKGFCDLIAVSGEKIRLVEIKVPNRDNFIIPKADKEKMMLMQVPKNVSREVWYWRLGKGWEKVIF